ncbi:MAG: hypothetical protein RLZZ458_84 [Planctomycetota bacterium]|jgi:hypothetical protein
MTGRSQKRQINSAMPPFLRFPWTESVNDYNPGIPVAETGSVREYLEGVNR